MSDPWQVFKRDANRQETLRIIWPELYNTLADADGAGPSRTIQCVIGSCGLEKRSAVEAVGRLFQNGPPACREHIAYADRPGGWPLKAEVPK